MIDTCPRCYGRGYKPEARKASRRNPNALGFYARTCPRCGGTGSAEVRYRVAMARPRSFSDRDAALAAASEYESRTGAIVEVRAI